MFFEVGVESLPLYTLSNYSHLESTATCEERFGEKVSLISTVTNDLISYDESLTPAPQCGDEMIAELTCVDVTTTV